MAYKVLYYRFSYTKDADIYYLKAEDDGKISWEKTASQGEAHKFYLPAAHAEGKFYLHDHNGHLVQVSKDGSKLSLDNSGDIYSTVNAINDVTEDQPATLRWTITKKGEFKDTWAVVDPTLFGEDGNGDRRTGNRRGRRNFYRY